MEASQTLEYVMHNIVKIVDEEGTFYGTAFFLKVNGKNFCFTTHRCIIRLDKIFIERDNKKYHATWLGEFSAIDKDIAVLEVKNSPIAPLKYNLQALLRLEVSVCGFSGDELENFPYGRAIEGKLSENVLAYTSQQHDPFGSNEWNKSLNVHVNVLAIDGFVDPGFAGAPVLYKGDNNVVGMVVAVHRERETRETGFLIPIQTLLEKFSTKNIESEEEEKAIGPMTQEVEAVKPSTHLTRDAYALVDMLGYGLIVHACYTFLIHKDTKPPLCISIQSPWGGGKTSFMRMMQEKLDPGSSRFTTARERDTKEKVKKENAIKTLKQLRANPKYNISKPYYTVWFNAWKYHNSEQIWSGLADAIVTQISEQFGDQKEKFLMDLQRQRMDPERVESLVRNSEAKTWKENL
jgi:KAP family P-loop domain/Trypsin-like peptidase domain